MHYVAKFELIREFENVLRIDSRKRLYSYDGKQCPVSCADTAANNVSDHVAVYLAELTSEMVTEMKSELREMVNAVDEIISPSNGDKNHSGSFDTIGRNRTVSLTLKEEWEDSDDSQSQYETKKSDGML